VRDLNGDALVSPRRHRASRRVPRAVLIIGAACLVVSAFAELPALASTTTTSTTTTTTTIPAKPAGVTALAPICPTREQTEGLPVEPCFPPNNGNESQSTTGDQEINGTVLKGPTVLAAKQCSGVPVATAGDIWCTPAFTLTLTVPSSLPVKEELGFTLSANDLPGTETVTTPGSTCTACTTKQLGNETGPQVLKDSPGGEPYWCANYYAKTPPSCKSWTVSSPLVIQGEAGHFSTMQVCAAGVQALYYTNGTYGNFTACIQVQIQYKKSKSSPSNALLVALAGQRGSAPDSVAVTMTLSNGGSSDISGLSFSDATGLENDGIILTKGNIGPTKSGLELTIGPNPALPTNLPANGPPIVVNYTYTATSTSDAVLVAKVSGTGHNGKIVKGKSALTIFVTNPPATEADYAKLVTSALLAEDSVTSEAENTEASTEADSLAKSLGLPAASPGQQAAAVSLGLPTQLGVLAGAPNKGAFSQWVGNYYTTLSGDLKGGAAYLGQTGAALASELVQNVTDPQARAAALGRLWDGIQALPATTQAALASQSDNLGYAGQALLSSMSPLGQANGLVDSATAGVTALKSLGTDVSYAANGFSTMVAADNASYNKDPTAFINAESKQYADATYDLIKTEIATVIGDGIGKGVASATKAGYSALAGNASTIDSTVAGAITSAPPAASTSTAALIQNASVATSQFQTLEAGTALTADQITALGGLTQGDQVGVQAALDYIKKTFNVDLELGVRTSEPLSVGIDGSPKLSFMKPKAVSAMDMMMGAPQEIAAYSAPGEAASSQTFQGGVTTVFEPKPIAPADLAAIGDVNPNFVTQYNARFAGQTKLWNEYQDANSTLRVLVKGSADSENGVTAIANVPGFPVPPPPGGAQPLIYLQQLDQPAFVAKFGLTTDEAQTLKASLTNSPGAVQVDYIARPNPDGSISFFDGLKNNIPYVSDLDLQFVQPANGAPWPSGLMSKIQLEFQNQLQKNLARLPDHGASGTAFDLPAANIAVADSFVLGTANPAFAPAVANNLAQRYASQSAIFSSNAARLTSLAGVEPDAAKAKALYTQAKLYRSTAATFSKVDAAYLLAKYPPGEKIIVIKLGDVRVGYGPST
jgi:hypothetical protein